MELLTWMGILLCLSQSALFSGMNLGLFSISRLELQLESRKGNQLARRVLRLREQANLALVTILWGNVAVNVLLALLSGSVLTGVLAFLFSTVVITIFAEILPQAWFTRNALPLAARLYPWLRFWQYALYPVTRPTAWALDRWLGGEQISYFRERDLRQLIRLHMEASESDIARVEGQGALNFLEVDDITMAGEGEPLHPDSVIALDFVDGKPQFPLQNGLPEPAFLQRLVRPGTGWVVLTEPSGERPQLVLEVDRFVRAALLTPERFEPLRYCHRPTVVSDAQTRLGSLMPRFKVQARHEEDDIVDHDVILLWGEQRRIVTGTDILGRLLRGIVRREAL